ncbi:MAG: hypothetical protein ACRENV_04800, partial [Candidatus Dormibacteria bacterium]
MTGSGGALDLSQVSLELVDDPGTDAIRARAAPSRLSQELMGARLARHLGCEVEDLGPARAEASADWDAYVRRLFSDANIRGLVLDPGWSDADPATASSDLAQLSQCPVRAIMRVDPLVDQLIADGAGAGEVLERVEAAVAGAPAQGYVGLKTILAYRTGLAVDPGASL